MNGRSSGHENLTPIQPGEVRNPSGVNQYTYRDDAKRKFSELCKDNADGFLDGIFKLAKEGESWAAKMVWEEIMPTVKTIEHLIPGADPLELEDAIDAFLAKRGPGSADAEPPRPRTNGNGGMAP